MRGALDCVSAKISPTESTEVFTIHSYSASDLTQKRRDVESQSSPEHYSSQRNYYWLFFVDLPLFIILLTLIGLFETGIIPSHKSGFYCNDPALSFPYRGDTIGTSTLMIGLLLMPVVVFLLTEFALTSSDGEQSKLLRIFKSSCLLYRSYAYGLMMNLCIVELMKGLKGGPRPTFFDLCKPDTAQTCNGTEFVSTFQCTSSYSSWEQMDSYRSFPSGHTSMSIYCGFFLAWYLQMRAFDWSRHSVILVPFIQLCVISFAVVSSLTRITDHRHHWWDVLTGSVVGVITVLYSVICLCNNFSNSSEDITEEECSRKSTRTILYDEQS